jgi:hypothetical protein
MLAPQRFGNGRNGLPASIRAVEHAARARAFGVECRRDDQQQRLFRDFGCGK